MADFTYAKRSPGMVPFNFFNPDNIVQNRAPTAADRAELSALWLQPRDSAGTPVDSVWMLTNPGVWTLLTNAGGAGVFTSLTVTPGPINLTGSTAINTAAGAQDTVIGGLANTGNTVIGNSGNTSTLIAGAIVGVETSAAGTISIGSVALTTGNIVIGQTMTSGNITIGGTGASTGTISLAPGTGIQSLLLAAGAGAKTITIGGAGANTITIANTQVGGTLNISNASGPAVLLNNATSITGPASAAIGLTVNTTAGTGVGARITSVDSETDALVLINGGLQVTLIADGPGVSPRTADARHFVCDFTDNVPAGTTVALDINNNLAVGTSEVFATVTCSTAGSACIIRDFTAAPGVLTFNVTNLGGTDTGAGSVVIRGWIMAE